jgi:hypothetical protein
MKNTFFTIYSIHLSILPVSSEGSKRTQKIDQKSMFGRQLILTVDLQSLIFPAKTWHPVMKYRLHDGKGEDDKIVTIA